MYARLSPASTQFVNRGSSMTTGDTSYRQALETYSAEITSIIKQVCDELSERGSDELWTVEADEDDSDEGDQQINLKLREHHSDSSFTWQIDGNFESKWIYHNPNINEDTIEAIKAIKTPGIKKYFDIYCSEDGVTISSTFSKRQLISRYVVDYILHLTNQMQPAMSVIANSGNRLAAVA
jgi:hypothetical protein